MCSSDLRCGIERVNRAGTHRGAEQTEQKGRGHRYDRARNDGSPRYAASVMIEVKGGRERPPRPDPGIDHRHGVLPFIYFVCTRALAIGDGPSGRDMGAQPPVQADADSNSS